jgi:hypothetical protein
MLADVSDSFANAFPAAFPGIKWSINLPHVHVTNTCPLDSLLTLTYALHKCNVFTNDWPQLSDDHSLLSRSFVLLDNNQCDDARLLWLKEFYGHNDTPPTAETMGRTERKIFTMFGTCSKFFDCEELAMDGRKITNPVRDAVQLEFKQQSTCLREGGCGVPDKSVTGKVRQKNLGNLRAMSTSDDPLDLLKGNMEEHTTTGTCAIEWEQNLEGLKDEVSAFDPAEIAGRRYCPGHVLNSNATEVHWPHTLVIEYPPSCRENNISSISQSFIFKEKQFVLRGAILGDGHVHFTACMKAGTHWLYYDGLESDNSCPGSFFQLMPINNGEKAMNGYGLAYVFYEVLDLDDQIENEVTLSRLDIIMPEIGEVQKVQREVKAADILVGLKDIVRPTLVGPKKNHIARCDSSFIFFKNTLLSCTYFKLKSQDQSSNIQIFFLTYFFELPVQTWRIC